MVHGGGSGAGGGDGGGGGGCTGGCCPVALAHTGGAFCNLYCVVVVVVYVHMPNKLGHA